MGQVKIRKRYIVLLTMLVTIIGQTALQKWWRYNVEQTCAESFNVRECKQVWLPVFTPVKAPLSYDQG